MLPVVEITRLEEWQGATIGVLRLNKEVVGFTLEPPDRLNERSRSSVPSQQYVCAKHKSPRFGDTYIVQEVPGRDNVLFHPGNSVRDTEGCIILGASVGALKGDRAVLNSGATFAGFMAKLEGADRFTLTIHENY